MTGKHLLPFLPNLIKFSGEDTITENVATGIGAFRTQIAKLSVPVFTRRAIAMLAEGTANFRLDMARGKLNFQNTDTNILVKYPGVNR